MKDLERIAALLTEIEASPEPAAVATLADVQGSSYRRTGARLVVTASGRTAGGISAGCLEADVVEHALRVIKSGKPAVITYDAVADADMLIGFGMGCGGTLKIVVEPLTTGLSRWLAGCGGDRTDVVASATVFEAGDPTLLGTVAWVSPTEVAADGSTLDVAGASLPADGPTLDVAWASLPANTGGIRNAIESDLRRTASERASFAAEYRLDGQIVRALIHALPPPVRLVIVGAGDDAVPLSRMARELGWRVAVVDIRSGLLTDGRFADATMQPLKEYADFRSTVPITPPPAVVIMTHNYAHDLDLLRQIVPANPAYIGLLGARHRTRRLFDDLRTDGVVTGDGLPSNLHSPAGLDIGSETPEAIALSIVAEIQAELTGRNGGRLRDRI